MIRLNSYAAYRISYQYRIMLRIPYTNMIRIFGDDPLTPAKGAIENDEKSSHFDKSNPRQTHVLYSSMSVFTAKVVIVKS